MCCDGVFPDMKMKASTSDPSTTAITAVGDLNCPFCFALNEWIDELGYGSTVSYFGIEHMADLTPEKAVTQDALAEMKAEYEKVLERTCGDLALNLPPKRPSSALAIATLLRVETIEPERLGEARTRLFRALWHDGQDFSRPEVIRERLRDFDLGNFADMSTELSLVKERTRKWINGEINYIPAILSPTGVNYIGMGTKKALKIFFGSALFSSQNEGVCRS